LHEQLFYRLRGSGNEQIFGETDGKFECPICKMKVKNIQIHLNKNSCINQIDVDHFEASFSIYKKVRMQRINKGKKDRMKSKDPQMFKEKTKIYKKTFENQNPDDFRKKNLENVIRHQNKQKSENPTEYQKQNTANVQKSQNK